MISAELPLSLCAEAFKKISEQEEHKKTEKKCFYDALSPSSFILLVPSSGFLPFSFIIYLKILSLFYLKLEVFLRDSTN